jgi:hypothetical protein
MPFCDPLRCLPRSSLTDHDENDRMLPVADSVGCSCLEIESRLGHVGRLAVMAEHYGCTVGVEPLAASAPKVCCGTPFDMNKQVPEAARKLLPPTVATPLVRDIC